MAGTTGGAGTTGAAGTGPAAPTACTIGPASNGSGSFTYYWFGQGSGRDGSGYRTACGYYGTENGQTDTIENIASMSPANATYFAAIPGTNGFNTSGYCGACVQITGQNGKQIIATVADECPYGGDGNNSACQRTRTATSTCRKRLSISLDTRWAIRRTRRGSSSPAR